MQQPSKPRHGGSRQGAGRKLAYGEPTKTVRVPQSLVPVVVSYLDGIKNAPEAGAFKGRPISSNRVPAYVVSLGRRVRAGKPASGDDFEEDAVDLGSHLVRDPDATFVIHVDGWSMRDAGISNGDELVVDRSVTVAAGRIVVAEIDGEVTVKRLQHDAGRWILQAANPDFPDLVVTGKNELHIWGVVTHVIRKL